MMSSVRLKLRPSNGSGTLAFNAGRLIHFDIGFGCGSGQAGQGPLDRPDNRFNAFKANLSNDVYTCPVQGRVGCHDR